MQIDGMPSKFGIYEMIEASETEPSLQIPGKRAKTSPGVDAAPLSSEEMIETLLGLMSSELSQQAQLDRLSIQDYKKKCRAMRKMIQKQIKKIQAAAKQKRRRGLAAKIFKWAAAVLGAIAAVAGAIFSGGGTVAAYAVAIGAAVAAGASGAAGGSCSIAASAAAKKELDAGADLKKAQIEQQAAKQMQSYLLAHMEDLIELDGRIGNQARSIMQRYDSLRQQSIKWR